MDLEVLDFLIENESYINEQAKSAGAKPEISLVVAKILSDNKGDLNSIKGGQVFHYEKVLRPLFENVECTGPVGYVEGDNGELLTSCVNGGVVDEESLYQSYQEEDFLCQICRYDMENMK